MKKTLLLILALVPVLFLAAQKSGSVQGLVYDTIAREPVSGATVTLMNREDSSLVTFTMTGSNGQFSLGGLKKGDYRLLVTHVNYHNGNKYFVLGDSAMNIDMGNVVLNDKQKVLEEVVVMAEAPPVTIIGDTIQYNAGSFKTKPNAVVEDLLKKMPGIQVDKDGKIKAQGEEVKKVLVDGKEFFGNDPKVATKNLPADAVDKVQVYDKKSDAAELTGFDDGDYEKTINLKLKQDKKKGVFGKISAGGGTDNRYEARMNVNAFKGARQLSVIGMGNNTNAEGFSFMDILGFMGGMSDISGRGGNISISIGANDANGNLLGQGGNSSINKTWAGGVNYNNIVGNKLKFNGNYLYNNYSPATASKTARQYIFPDSSSFYNESSWSRVTNKNQRLNFVVDYFIDSMHSLKFTPSFSYQQSANRSYSDYETLAGNLKQNNNGFSNNYSTGSGYNFNNTILFRKRFAKRGRTFSFSAGTRLSDNDNANELLSTNNFYNRSGVFLNTMTLNQHSNTSGTSRNYSLRGVYTEPLFKKSLLELSASNARTRSTADKETYDYNSSSGKFDRLNDSLTNNYENLYSTNMAGLRIRKQGRKYSYALGLSWQNANLEGTIINDTKDSVIGKSFYNWLPNAQFRYQFSRFKNLNLYYRTYTTQPTVSQLQPVPDNSNTLNIKLGNPNLKQEFAHSLQLSYTGVNPFRNKSLFVFSNFTVKNNSIVNYDIPDTLGRKITTYVNVDGVYNLSNNVSLGLPLKFMKGNVNINAGFNFNHSRQFISGLRNDVNNYSVDPEFTVYKTIREKLDLSFSAGMTFSRAEYSLQSSLNNKYFTQDYGTDVGWEMPKNFYLSTDFRYTINSQRAEGFNVKVPLWNASLSKQFLKFNRGEIKFRVYDLLNKNQGIQRNAYANYIEDISSKILKRYYLLSFTFSLNKMGAGQPGGHGEIRVIRGR